MFNETYTIMNSDIIEELENLKKTVLPTYIKNMIEHLTILTYDNMELGMHGGYKILKKGELNTIVSFEIANKVDLDRRKIVYERLKGLDKVLISDASMSFARKGELYFYFSQSTFCTDGDLRRYLHSDERLQGGQDQLFPMFESLGQTLVEIHRRGLYFIDIKPENMLVCHVDGERIVKFTDIEDAVVVTNESFECPKALTSTHYYSSQIAYMKRKHGAIKSVFEWIDWHAYAMTLLVCYFGPLGFKETGKQEQITKILENRGLPETVIRCAKFINNKNWEGNPMKWFPGSIEIVDNENALMRECFGLGQYKLKF